MLSITICINKLQFVIEVVKNLVHRHAYITMQNKCASQLRVYRVLVNTFHSME